MRLWVFKRHFSTIFQLHGGGNDNTDRKFRKKLEAQVSLYRSPDINKSS